MSFLRFPLYVWEGSDGVHIWRRESDDPYDAYVRDCDFTAGVRMPQEVFDALCLMRVAELDEEHNRRKYERKALKYAGNFGSYALLNRLKIPKCVECGRHCDRNINLDPHTWYCACTDECGVHAKGVVE